MNYEELKDKLFAYAYGSALHDAVNQQAFQGKKKPLRNNQKAQNIAKEYIDAILAGSNPDFYETAEKIEDSFAEFVSANYDEIATFQEDANGDSIIPQFRFGNAQKLINMTVKNMYLLAYADENLRDKFYRCHSPMDNRIVDLMRKELTRLKTEGDKEATALLDQWRDCGNTGWSRIESTDREKYEKFQVIIRFLAEKDGISPIEYDFKMWVREANP